MKRYIRKIIIVLTMLLSFNISSIADSANNGDKKIYKMSEEIKNNIKNGIYVDCLDGFTSQDVKAELKWGVIDTKGSMVIEPEYDSIGIFRNGLAVVEKNEKYGMINKSGNLVLDVIYRYIDLPKEESIPISVYMDNKKVRFADRNGNFIGETEYEYIGYFSEGFAAAKKDEKYGYVDINGETVIQPKFKYASLFFNGLASVKLDGKYGLIDSAGNWVIEPVYEKLYYYGGKFMVVSKNDKYAYLNINGEFLTDFAFDYASNFENGIAYIRIGELYGLINDSGDVVAKAIYDKIKVCSNKTAYVKKDEKWGIVDKNGEFIIEPVYKNLVYYDDGSAQVWENDSDFNNVNFGYINTSSKLAVDNIYEKIWVSIPEVDIIAVRLDKKWGFVNRHTGEYVIEPVYDDVGEKKTTFAGKILFIKMDYVKVKKNGKWGLVDKDGNLVVEPKYDDIYGFFEGLAPARYKDKWGLIDKTGNFVIQPVYDRLITPKSLFDRKNTVPVREGLIPVLLPAN